MVPQQALRQEGFLGNTPNVGQDGGYEWPVTFFTHPPFTTTIGESTLTAAGIPPLPGRKIIADVEGMFQGPPKVSIKNLADGGYVPGTDQPSSWE